MRNIIEQEKDIEQPLNVADIYLFNTGNAHKAYLTFGCHYIEKVKMHRFCVWAPHAKSVSVVGDFNNWDESKNEMQKANGGIFYIFVSGVSNGDLYKYLIVGCDGVKRYKSDPFAFYAELRPGNASKVWSLEGYQWEDGSYIEKRDKIKKNVQNGPVSVYEVHLGSWMKQDEDEDSFPNYREIADNLAPYVKKMGFTHIEIMPITEFPLDMSWGYQVIGYYGVTSRYGTPQDFMYFMDKMHEAGIGVILDWVPAHFPKDAHGLALFDGTHLFDHQDPRQGEQLQWGTYIFNYGRPEVQSFLVSSAMFFADVYHVDGIRIDAVSAMLYLDFGKQDGQYVKNKDGGNINLEAVEFLRYLNTVFLAEHHGCMTIAEESTAYPLVTKPALDGGLGFTYKWNMGYMNDMLEYMEMDHLFRRDHHHAVTFSMQYAFSEHYIMPFSHDEVVHCKKSMVDKMFGTYDEKFSSLRGLYGYMFAHPGKKLLFMGAEFAQYIEWNYQKGLDWFLCEEYEKHKKMQLYVEKLNKLYKKYRALYEIEDSWDGFTWLNADDYQHSVIAFMRNSKPRAGKVQRVVCVVNFTPIAREAYEVNMPCKGVLKEILNSDDKRFGGSDLKNADEIKVVKKVLEKAKGKIKAKTKLFAPITLPPLSAVYFEFISETK